MAEVQVWAAFAAVAFVAGAIDSIVDVAQNAHGLRVQRIYGRSIVNSFHGVWSIGSVIGGLMGSAAVALDMPLSTHLAISGAVFSGVALSAYRFLLPGPENAERAAEDPVAATAPASQTVPLRDRLGSVLGGVAGLLLALGVLALCGAVVEDAGSSWGALYLRNELGTGAAAGGLAFVVLATTMTIGRLTGARAVDRFGQRAVVRAGGLVTAAGMGFALAFPSVPTTLIGYALAGIGVATVVPAAMHTTDELPGVPHGVGLAVVSWVLRAGFLPAPPLVGMVADATSLRVGLLVVVVAGLLAAWIGRLLMPKPAAGTTAGATAGTTAGATASAASA